MGQKVHPTGFRVGIMTGWKSDWFAAKRDFADLLVEDNLIRKAIPKQLRKIITEQSKKLAPSNLGLSKIQIERTREKVVVSLHTSRAGLIVGKGGATIDALTAALEKLTQRVIEVKMIEVARPETDPKTISAEIAEKLEKRSSFRRTMKEAMEKAMSSGAKGIKLQLSGRLGGAEMARCEKGMQGSVPLSTLRTRVDYGFTEASTPQGNIGIKVWVNNGDYLIEETTDAANAQTRQVSKKPARKGPR